MKNRCKLCKKDAGNYRICPTCYEANFAPCIVCGEQTPHISKFGKPTSKMCRPCTSKSTAPFRRIGKTCLVCGDRFQSDKKANRKAVCNTCLEIKTPCPRCGKPMLKFKVKGGQRHFCGQSCTAKHKQSQEHRAKITKTKIENHPVYRSHQNKIARSRKEFADWRTEVFKRDSFTCQKCGKGGKNLHPHHIKSFAEYVDLRFDVTNGITLCQECHRKEHNHVFIGRTKFSHRGCAPFRTSDIS